MNVTAWLQSLDLERYDPLFRDDEIDREVLPKLTSEDLKEIGVLAIGHRRKLLDASPRLALRFRPQPWRQLSSRARLVRVSRAEAPLDTPPLAAHQIMEKLWDINVKGFHRRDGITVDAMAAVDVQEAARAKGVQLQLQIVGQQDIDGIHRRALPSVCFRL